jgi:hypothetical protein
MNENLPVIDSTNENLALQPVSPDALGDLTQAEASPIDLMSDYWTPVSAGESRRVYFDRIQPMGVVDQQSGEIIQMDCAFFFWQERPGEPYKQIRNGSKRLVGAIQQFNLPRLTPLEIKYAGKKRNATNQFMSDNWAITPLKINVSTKQ